MNNQYLKPFSTGETRARELGRIGAQVKSPGKKIAAKLRELKKKGLTEENSRRIYDIMTEGDISALDIFVLLESIRSKAQTIDEKTRLARLYIEFHKLRHGTKLRVESQSYNTNINVEVNMAELVKQSYLEARQKNNELKGVIKQ